MAFQGAMPTLFATILVSVLAAGCATPATYTDRPGTVYDKDTSYVLEDQPDGFVLTVDYARYQFIPESGAVQTSCKSQLTSLAHELADKRGRKIQPVDEQRVKISMGRNGVTGITSCAANVRVFYADVAVPASTLPAPVAVPSIAAPSPQPTQAVPASPSIEKAPSTKPSIAAAVAAPKSLPGGQDAYQAGRVAQTAQCHSNPIPILIGKGPGNETYSVACSNGDTLAVRCEFGTCRALK